MTKKLSRNLSLPFLKFQTHRSFFKIYSVVVYSTNLFLFSCKLASPDQSPVHLPKGDAEGHHDGKHGLSDCYCYGSRFLKNAVVI